MLVDPCSVSDRSKAWSACLWGITGGVRYHVDRRSLRGACGRAGRFQLSCFSKELKSLYGQIARMRNATSSASERCFFGPRPQSRPMCTTACAPRRGLMLLLLLSSFSPSTGVAVLPAQLNATRPLRLAFLGDMGMRGTALAMFDYADFAERLLRVPRPLILYRRDGQFVADTFAKYTARFGDGNVIELPASPAANTRGHSSIASSSAKGSHICTCWPARGMVFRQRRCPASAFWCTSSTTHGLVSEPRRAPQPLQAMLLVRVSSQLASPPRCQTAAWTALARRLCHTSCDLSAAMARGPSTGRIFAPLCTSL